MLKTKSEKYFNSITVAAAFSFTLLFYIPANLFLNNIMEYSMELWEILLFAIVLALAGTLVTAFLLGIFNQKTHRVFTVIFGTIAVLMWVEANFVPWKLGALDGNLEWDNVPYYYYYFDTLGWFIILGVCLWKLEHTYKIMKQISLILIMTQFIVLGLGIYSAPARPQTTKYQLDYSKQFEFSSKKNVILLVVDGAQTDVFQELLNEDPQYINQFKNFTYFRDTLTGFPITSLSMPGFLTGRYYDNSMFMEDYLKEAYKNSLPSVLKENNFNVGIYPTVRNTLLYDRNVFDNFVKRKSYNNRSKSGLEKLYKEIVPLKAVPYGIKRLVQFDLWPGLSVAEAAPSAQEPDVKFINELKDKIKIIDESYVFRYYHLHGVHPPLGMDRNLQPIKAEYNLKNYKEQYRGVLKIVDMFLQELKSKGIYENSMIVVMADHGSWLHSFNKQVLGLTGNGEWEAKYSGVMGESHPVLLIKRINSQEPFSISDAPVSLSDIPRTVAEELNLKNNLPGKSVFKISENEKRERIFYRGELSPDSKATPFVEFKVNGNSWLHSSWQEGNTKMPKNFRHFK